MPTVCCCKSSHDPTGCIISSCVQTTIFSPAVRHHFWLICMAGAHLPFRACRATSSQPVSFMTFVTLSPASTLALNFGTTTKRKIVCCLLSSATASACSVCSVQYLHMQVTFVHDFGLLTDWNLLYSRHFSSHTGIDVILLYSMNTFSRAYNTCLISSNQLLDGMLLQKFCGWLNMTECCLAISHTVYVLLVSATFCISDSAFCIHDPAQCAHAAAAVH